MSKVKNIHLFSLGCAKNLVDSEVLLGCLQKAQFNILDKPLGADTLIVNTCGFLDSAREESVDVILDACRMKVAGDVEKVVVMGCFSARYPDELIKEICDSMIEMGWGPYQNDHEDANGQFEMNWDYDHCLVTADRHVFFKYMVKSLAEKHGLRATFMPKPFNNLTGNGCHAHISLWNEKSNKFLDSDNRYGLSKLAYNFLGGVIKLARPLSAFFNPTINSYRRINAPPTKSGASWSPSSISYSGNNRTHMIRIPDPGRFELRLMDGSANPYLLQAGVIASGLYGLNNKSDPGELLTCNMYTDYKKYPNLKKLPNDIEESLRELDDCKELRESFEESVINSYIKLKKMEIKEFNREEVFNKKSDISDWEKNNTLDC